VQDTYLIQDKSTNNYGSDKDLKVKPDENKERRILIAFQLTSIPKSSTVRNATLRLYEDNKKNNQTIYLHRLTSSWVESQATWNHRSSGVSWNSRGGDFDNTVLASLQPDVDNRYRDMDVTGITQSWVNGSAPNYGLLLRSTGSNGEVKFKSKEESNQDKQPKLCVTY
jgi:hypothetical protein